MSDDEEILCIGTDLYNHLVDQGYADFGTFKSNQNDRLYKNNESTLINKNYIENKPPDLAAVSSHDHHKLMNILNSQLLFKEDVELVESVLSNTFISDNGSNYFFISGAVAMTLVSSAMLFKRGINIYIPLSLTTVCSVYSIWQYYKHLKERSESKMLACYIDVLQKLCSNIHKLLRFLKETEILSTGQVSSFSIGSAMYISVNNIKELDKLPSWKTLPHLRKDLADALVRTINILSFACDAVRKVSPDWMSIQGYDMSLSQVSLREILSSYDNLSCFEGCIPIKDLQCLNNAYLVLQSEYLRWVAFCFCPVAWNNSCELMSKCKTYIFKVFEDTQPKLSDISFKLKMQYNIQRIFPTTTQALQQNSLRSNFKEISNIQVEVHSIFLLMVSIVVRVKSLEDYLENFANTNLDSSISINSLKENLTQQLSTLRDDFACVIKDYDNLYYQTVSNKKSITSDHGGLEVDSVNNVRQPEPRTTGITVGLSDFQINSPDEVFLATSDSNMEQRQTYTDECCIERKPKIPKTLLKELSTSLKSRKKDFKERERLALERVGLQDIGNKSDTDNSSGNESETLKQSWTGSSSVKPTKYLSKRTNSGSSVSDDEINMALDKVLPLITMDDKKNHRLDLMSLSEMHLKSVNYENQISEIIDTGANSPSLSSSSLANLIAMKSQSWGKTSEECYSND